MTTATPEDDRAVGQYTWYDGRFLLRPRCIRTWHTLDKFKTLKMVNDELLKETLDDGLPTPPSEGWLLSIALTRMGWTVTPVSEPPIMDGCRLYPPSLVRRRD